MGGPDSIDCSLGEQHIAPFADAIMLGNQAEIETALRQTGIHQHNRLSAAGTSRGQHGEVRSMPGTDDECRRAPVAAGKTPGQPMPESLSAGQSGNLTYLQRDQLCQCLYKSLGLSLVATLSIDNAPNYNRICQDPCLSNCSERFPGSRKRMSGATRPERGRRKDSNSTALKEGISYLPCYTVTLRKRRRVADSDTGAGRKTTA